MAERSNAHDSKSCYAGMYTRVQIPFSAPMPVFCTVLCNFIKKSPVFGWFLVGEKPNTGLFLPYFGYDLGTVWV